MKQFDFPYFSFSTEYLKNSIISPVGKHWAYHLPPYKGKTLIHTLYFNTMRYDTTQKDISINELKKFYEEHETWKPFIFWHPTRGRLVCRFHSPIVLPKLIPGGGGVTEPMEVSLIELYKIPATPNFENRIKVDSNNYLEGIVWQ